MATSRHFALVTGVSAALLLCSTPQAHGALQAQTVEVHLSEQTSRVLERSAGLTAPKARWATTAYVDGSNDVYLVAGAAGAVFRYRASSAQRDSLSMREAGKDVRGAISWIGSCDGQVTAAYNFGTNEFVEIAPDFRSMRKRRIPQPSTERPISAFSCSGPDAMALLLRPSLSNVGRMTVLPGEVFRLPSQLVFLVDRTTRVRTIGWPSGALTVLGNGGVVSAHGAGQSLIAGGSGFTAVADAFTGMVTIFDRRGQVDTTFGTDGARVKHSAVSLQRAIDASLAFTADSGIRDRMSRRLRELPEPELEPAIASLIVDRHGMIWIEQPENETRKRKVVARTRRGQLVTSIKVSATFSLLGVGDSTLVASEIVNGEQIVRTYKFRR